jgi:hypothetical protein
LIKGLKRAEQQLEKQLEGIRSAIASLEFGAAVSPGLPGGRRGPGRPASSGGTPRRTISARGRKAISEAQKARWARQKAQEKRK